MLKIFTNIFMKVSHFQMQKIKLQVVKQKTKSEKIKK